MGEYKLHREQRGPVGPNRLSRLIEVVTAVVFVLVVVYMDSALTARRGLLAAAMSYEIRLW